MRTRKPAVLAVLAVASVTLSGCGFTGLYGAPLPGGADLGDHPFKVTALFDDALDLVPQSAVKVNDVAVGKVTAISLQGWSAKVTMEVNDAVKLPANATAEIAQSSLLGEKYVSLNPPTVTPATTQLRNGALIPLNRTRSAAEVEQVLGALSLLLNEGGLRQIRTIGDELVKALKGREPQIKSLLGQLNTFVGTLDDQKSKITTALDRINRLAITLNRQKGVLVETLETFPAALRVLAQERSKFTTLLTSLDRLGRVATDVINNTQDNLVTSLKALEPTLVQLKNSGDFFPKALKIAGTFPFPLGVTRQLVKGDYANLSAYLNLDLNDTLCGLSKALCPSSKTASTESSSKAGATQTGAARTGAATTGTSTSGASRKTSPDAADPGVLVQSGR